MYEFLESILKELYNSYKASRLNIKSDNKFTACRSQLPRVTSVSMSSASNQVECSAPRTFSDSLGQHVDLGGYQGAGETYWVLNSWKETFE